MISRKNLWNLCDKYIREVISGPLGPSDLKYKGNFHWVREFPMQQYEPMVDPPKPISMSFSVGRIEIETRSYNGSWMYETRVRFTYKNHQHVSAFEISQESWSRQALEYHFKEYCCIFEKETGLIKLTPEEEYQKEHAEFKKKVFAELYGASADKSVGQLKAEIEQLKTKTTQQWVVYKYEYKYETDPYTGQYLYQGGQKYGKTKQVGSKSGSFKSPQGYDNAGNELAKIIPALSYKGAMCPAAGQQTETSNSHCHMQGQTLSELIIHLNDNHRWPRSGTDPNPNNFPNIADWIDEVCLTHNLDQSFHPPGEKQQERMKTLEEVNKAQQESVKNNKQAIKKITYKNPKKLTKNEAVEAIEGAKLAFHIEDEPFYPKGMFDGA